MNEIILSVREMEEKDIPLIADYWFTADGAYLKEMGVDISKMPERGQFATTLKTQLGLPYEEKKAYALIWEANGKAIGHCNLNPIVYGKEGFMHLHIWKPEMRRMGFGVSLVQMSLHYFFRNLKPERIYCEPNALNAGPNKLLEKAGFSFLKEYVTTPGGITFEQPVKRWEIAPK